MTIDLQQRTRQTLFQRTYSSTILPRIIIYRNVPDFFHCQLKNFFLMKATPISYDWKRAKVSEEWKIFINDYA